MADLSSLKQRVALERVLDHERAQLQLQEQRGSASIAMQNGTEARPLVEIEEAMAVTEAHLKEHSAYSNISLAQKTKSFRSGLALQAGAGASDGASHDALTNEEEVGFQLKSSGEQGYDGGMGGQGNEEEEEEVEEEVYRSALSSGPLPWLPAPSVPPPAARTKTVRMSSPQGRTVSLTREKYGSGPAREDDIDDSSSGSGSEQEKGLYKGQAKKKPAPGWFKVGLVLPGGSEDEDEEELAEQRRAARIRSQAADAAREHIRRSSTSSSMSAAVNNTRPGGGRSRSRRESTVNDVPNQHKLLSRLEQRFSVSSNRSVPLSGKPLTAGPSDSTAYLISSPSARRDSHGSDSTAFGASPSMRIPNAKSAGQLPIGSPSTRIDSHGSDSPALGAPPSMRMPNTKSAGQLSISNLLSPSSSLARSTASAAASAVTGHGEGPTRLRQKSSGGAVVQADVPSSPVRRPRQASPTGALFSLQSSITTAPSWATSQSGRMSASGSAAAVGGAAALPHWEAEKRKLQHKSAAAYGEPVEQSDKPSATDNQGGTLLSGRSSGLMEAWGCNSGGVSAPPPQEPGIPNGQTVRARSTTAPHPVLISDPSSAPPSDTAPAGVHTAKNSTSGHTMGAGGTENAYLLGAGSAVATVRARKKSALSKGGGDEDCDDDGADAASSDCSPRLGNNSPRGPLFAPHPPPSEPGQVPHRGGRHTTPSQLVVGSNTTDNPCSPSPSMQDLHSHATTAQLSQSQGHPVHTRPSTAGSRSSTSPTIHGLEGWRGSHPSTLHTLSTTHPSPRAGKPAAQSQQLEGTTSLTNDEPVPKLDGESDRSGVFSKLLLPTAHGDKPTGSTKASMSEERPWHSQRSGGFESPHSSVHGPTKLSVNSSTRASPSEQYGAVSPNCSYMLRQAHSGVGVSQPQLELNTSPPDSYHPCPISAPMPKMSVVGPPPDKVLSDDGTRRAKTPPQEALKPPLPVHARPVSALKPCSWSTAPYLPSGSLPAGASKNVTGVSSDAPKTSVPDSSGSSPRTPTSPGTQEAQVRPSPASFDSCSPGGPIRIQSSRSMRQKSKASDEGSPGSADSAQQQPSPNTAGLAGFALKSARRRSALQASNAPLKATPLNQLMEPKARSLSVSEPTPTSKKPISAPIGPASSEPPYAVQPQALSTSSASAKAPAHVSKLQKNNAPEMAAARQPSKLGGRSSVDEKAKPRQPPAQTPKQRSSSEPRRRSKLRRNSSTEPGPGAASGGARGDTKHTPARGKSILNIKAALGSAMASVLNPVKQTQRK